MANIVDICRSYGASAKNLNGTAIKILLLRSTYLLVTFVLFCSIQSLALQQAVLLRAIPTQNNGEPELLTDPFALSLDRPDWNSIESHPRATG